MMKLRFGRNALGAIIGLLTLAGCNDSGISQSPIARSAQTGEFVVGSGIHGTTVPFTWHKKEFKISKDGTTTEIVSCDRGGFVVSGGYFFNKDPASYSLALNSFPERDDDAWAVTVRNVYTSKDAEVTVYAVCTPS